MQINILSFSGMKREDLFFAARYNKRSGPTALNFVIAGLTRNLIPRHDYAEAAKIAHCSSFHFQRMFSYIAGVPLSEYIRAEKWHLRRLICKTMEQKLLMLPFKYGYSIPHSF